MTHICVKINLFCELHKTHLVDATETESSFNLGRIELYSCCNFGCKLFISKYWIYILDKYVINFIYDNGYFYVVNPEENYESNDNHDIISSHNIDNSAVGGDDASYS